MPKPFRDGSYKIYVSFFSTDSKKGFGLEKVMGLEVNPKDVNAVLLTAFDVASDRIIFK